MSVLYIRDRNGDFIQIPTIPGKSAYEIAIEKGVFEGTEQEFAEMLVFSNKEILEQITQEDIDNWNSGGNGNIEIDLSGYTTKEEFNNLEKIETSEIEPTEEDVSIWIDVSKNIEIDEIARINDNTIADNTTWSSEKIDNAIKYIDISDIEIDLSGYITKEEFNNFEKIETSEIEPTEEDVSIWIDTSKDIITQEISRINDDTIADNTTWSSKKIDSIIKQQGEVVSVASINNIPTKTSQLVNDSNFISSIPSEYITETELAAEISRIHMSLICALSDIDAKEKSLTKIGKIVANQVTDDAVALSIQEFYDIWEEGVAYPVGRYITHNDILYKVLTEHTSQATWTPDVSPSLFVKVLIDSTGETIPDWVQPDSTNAYMIGDKVKYEGVVYVSLIDNNIWSPINYPSDWKVVED